MAAMCCKKWMAKRYIKKRKFYFIAFAIAFVSVIVMAVALILDELSGLTDASYCGCLALAGFAYADCADLETCSKAQLAGVFWIIFGGVAVILCFLGPLYRDIPIFDYERVWPRALTLVDSNNYPRKNHELVF